MKRYYTDKEYRQLIRNMLILVDTRDKSNQAILDEFDRQGIKYKKKALKTGDYSFAIEECPELGFPYETLFTDEIVIERKNSLDELAGNFANKTDDERIFKEMNRMINIERVYLLVENNKLDDIYMHNYHSEYNPDSFIRTLLTWQARNGMHIYFVDKENMARTIYELCKNCLDSKILK